MSRSVPFSCKNLMEESGSTALPHRIPERKYSGAEAGRTIAHVHASEQQVIYWSGNVHCTDTGAASKE